MCAATLLTRGANPRHADDSGVTALHLAACGGGVLVTRILLGAGADALAVNKDGQTPTDVARYPCRISVVFSGHLTFNHLFVFRHQCIEEPACNSSHGRKSLEAKIPISIFSIVKYEEAIAIVRRPNTPTLKLVGGINHKI